MRKQLVSIYLHKGLVEDFKSSCKDNDSTMSRTLNGYVAKIVAAWRKEKEEAKK